MTLREKILFHQVHPAKLATDVLSAVVSLYFFWQHQLFIPLLTHFVPPPGASTMIIRFADLVLYKRSRLGPLLICHLTPGSQAMLLICHLITIIAPSIHS